MPSGGPVRPQGPVAGCDGDSSGPGATISTGPAGIHRPGRAAKTGHCTFHRVTSLIFCLRNGRYFHTTTERGAVIHLAAINGQAGQCARPGSSLSDQSSRLVMKPIRQLPDKLIGPDQITGGDLDR